MNNEGRMHERYQFDPHISRVPASSTGLVINSASAMRSEVQRPDSIPLAQESERMAAHASAPFVRSQSIRTDLTLPLFDPTLPESAFEVVPGTPLPPFPLPQPQPVPNVPTSATPYGQDQGDPSNSPSTSTPSPSFNLTLPGKVTAVYLLPAASSTNQIDMIGCLVERPPRIWHPSSSPSTSYSHSLLLIRASDQSTPEFVTRMDLRYIGLENERRFENHCSIQLQRGQSDNGVSSEEISLLIARGIWMPASSIHHSRSSVDIFSWAPNSSHETKGRWKAVRTLACPPECETYCVLSLGSTGQDGGSTIIAGGRHGLVGTWESGSRSSSAASSSSALDTFTPLPPATYKGLSIQSLMDLKIIPRRNNQSGLESTQDPSPLVLGTGDDGTIVVWDLASRQLLRSLHLPFCQMRPQAFPTGIVLPSERDQKNAAKDHPLLILAIGSCEPNSSQLPSVATRVVDRVIPISWSLTSRLDSPQSNILPAPNLLEAIEVMQEEGKSHVGSMSGGQEVTSLAIDRKFAAIGTRSGHILIWDQKRGGLIGALTMPSSIQWVGLEVGALALQMKEGGSGFKLSAAIGNRLVFFDTDS